jgi:membrane protease YdiL (CAAX protease family)
LLWIIVRGEKRALTSIGWHTERPGRSLLWGLVGVVLCALALVACLGIISVLGIEFGGDRKSGFSPPAWAVLVTVVRAGVVEEAFYRGYAIDRVQLLTGNRFLAIALPLLVFAGAHYRQGVGGVLIALAMGGILSALFVKRRDLLAVMTAHFIIDFVPNVLLPLFSD